MKKIPIGKDNFKDIIENDYYYVDKTKVIEDLIATGVSVTLYTRPRRFGKSLLISTLDNFFNIEKKEENKNLFKDLYISKSEYYSYFGKYPVIRLDFKDLKGDNFETIYNVFIDKITSLYRDKSYAKGILETEYDINKYDMLMNGKASIDLYRTSISFLTNVLEKYYKEKVVVLIDEYDTPINEGHINGFYKEAMELIRGVLSTSLKGNDSLRMGILTGVLRVAKESLFSTFNNPKVYDVISKGYGEYFGFTKNETKELLEYYNLELTDEVSNMYDGYNIDGKRIYNPWSILNYVESGELKPYWINTGSNKLVKDLLINLKEDEKIRLENLLQSNNITFTYREGLNYENIEINNDFNSILNLLLFSGYLTFDRRETDEDDEITNYFRIPNNEVRNELINIVETIAFNKDMETEDSFRELKSNMINGEKEKIEKFINSTIMGMSYYDTLESYYHGYMYGLFSWALNKNYITKSNREAGSGRCDILIERKDKSVGIIIELKISDTEENMEKESLEGLNQMKEKEYYKELVLDKVTNIKEYIIVFHGKKAIVR